MGAGVGVFRRRSGWWCVCVRICGRDCGHGRWCISAWVCASARGACVGVGGCVGVQF